MKKLFYVLKKIVFSFLVLYGFNMIGVNFNFILPINVFSVFLIFFFDISGIILLILFKIIL